MTWIELVTAARRLETIAASHREIDPEDAEHLVGLVLCFDEQLAHPVRGSKESKA